MNNVLWVEDEADTSLIAFRTKLEMQFDYELDIVRNATDVIKKLKLVEFDAIIVDVRIPPGPDQKWIDKYFAGKNGLQFEQLGIFVIDDIIRLNDDILEKNKNPKKIGIFSIERKVDIVKLSEEKGCVESINQVEYLYKKEAEIPEDFLNFVKKLILNGKL